MLTLVLFGVFSSLDSSAMTITGPINTAENSQRIEILKPSYAVEIPQAIGGPNLNIDNRLALLTPQVGIHTGTLPAAYTEVDPDGIVVYVVQKGDTLSEIAENFDVSINTIKWENNLGSTLKPGKELRILPVTGVRHTIKKGDTFNKIANLYEVDTEDITIYNDISADKLIPGKKIIIPNGIKKTAVTKIKKVATSQSSKISTASSGSGYYIRPTGGRVTSKFGPRKGRYHYGIDYGAPTGTPIVAAASGTVLKTSCGSGYGKCLVIKHNNGTQTLYAHASKIFVAAGTKVQQGQKVAAVGSTGRSSGPHLHFEIIESNGKKRNVNFLQ